jgi:hypothetical protein
MLGNLLELTLPGKIVSILRPWTLFGQREGYTESERLSSAESKFQRTL